MCVCPSVACSVTCMRLIPHYFCLHVCVSMFQREAQKTSTNNDITSASINLFLPPTGRAVVGAQRRKQECQKWKTSVFAPVGRWACKGTEKGGWRKKEMVCWHDASCLKGKVDQRSVPVICAHSKDLWIFLYLLRVFHEVMLCLLEMDVDKNLASLTPLLISLIESIPS